jgi:hypothetical protein
MASRLPLLKIELARLVDQMTIDWEPAVFDTRFRLWPQAIDEIENRNTAERIRKGMRELVGKLENWPLVLREPPAASADHPGFNNHHLAEAGIRLLAASLVEEIDAIAEAEAGASAEEDGVGDYIDLDQMAALVNRSKRTLERQLKNMPMPAVEGGGGKKAEWLYADVRPWLENTYGKNLPARPPHAIR